MDLDIDECVESRDYCNKETESCVNEKGGYRCVPFSEVTTTTEDSTPLITQSTTTTTTTPKSVARVPCPRGYIFSDDSRRCVGNFSIQFFNNSF